MAAQIEVFLAVTLGLKLKDDACLGPLSQGIDFLGYRVYATHRLVRPRVLRHCRAKIENWAVRHVHVSAQGLRIRADAPALEALQAMLGSYWGHFKHANSVRLRRALFARFAWLAQLFDLAADGGISPRWVLQGETHARQAEVFTREWLGAWRWLQKGNRWDVMPPIENPVGAASWPRCAVRRKGETSGLGEPCAAGSRRPHRGRDAAPTALQAAALQADLRRRGIAYLRAAQTGWLKHGTRRREIVEWFLPTHATTPLTPKGKIP